MLGVDTVGRSVARSPLREETAMSVDAARAGTANAVPPMTGQEYLESIRDGREIYCYGERVADVTTHPAFRNATRMIARLYDALHDDEHAQVLTTPTDTGNGGWTHHSSRRRARPTTRSPTGTPSPPGRA
jgi:4-hydroxyphenylacetate 3-monooxygenase